jgi:hypothetical protein
MLRASSPLVPAHDVIVHVVLDDLGEGVRVYRETDEDQADLDTLVDGILTGQYNNPFRIVAFNTAEGWSRDVTKDVARAVLNRAIQEDRSLHGCVLDFVERETGDTTPILSQWIPPGRAMRGY